MNFENTRIYRLLSSLEAVTLNRFAKFIHSPYFNVNQRVTKLFDIVHNAIKEGNAVATKEELWIAVGFAVEYKDIKFRKLCNELIERFERFLTVETMEKDDLLQANLLIRALKDNNINILIEKHITKSSTIFEKIPDRSADYFLQKYIYEKNLQNLKSNYEKKEDIAKYINKEKYGELSRLLDTFYTIDKLRYANDVVTWNKQYKTEISINIDEVYDLIHRFDLSDKTAVRTYQLIYDMLTLDDNKQSFYELKQLARDTIHFFPKHEQSEIFDALFSFCVKWVNKGDLEFHSEYLDLHEWGISEEFILVNGKLSPTSFRNYVVIGLRVSEPERIEKYILTNIELLEKSKRHNAYYFNLSRVSWYQKNYDKVLEHLNQISYDDVWYNLNARTLLLATYYELDEIDPLYSQMDAFSTFLRREKSLNQRKHRYLNFISYLKRITNSYGDKKKISGIHDKLNVDNEVVNKPWLLDKIAEQLN